MRTAADRRRVRRRRSCGPALPGMVSRRGLHQWRFTDGPGTLHGQAALADDRHQGFPGDRTPPFLEPFSVPVRNRDESSRGLTGADPLVQITRQRSRAQDGLSLSSSAALIRSTACWKTGRSSRTISRIRSTSMPK